MKIGLVCPYDIYKGGGVQECIVAMQAELIKRGHDVLIVTPLPRDSNDKGEKDGVIFAGTSKSVKTPLHTTGQISVAPNLKDIDSMLANERFDILHFHEPWVPIFSRQLLSRSKAINIATFHAKMPETAVIKTMEKVVTPYTKSIMRYLDGLTAVSEAASEYVSTLTKKPITIIPNGIDLSRYKYSVKRKSGHKSVLYIGRLEKRKGVKYLLKAFAQLQQQDSETRLIIAGDGPDRQKLENAARIMRLKNVEFLGYIEEAKKLKLLSEADVFCSPALFGESFGIVLLEAMASGVPTVAGNNPGYVGVMKGRGQLSIVNPKDTLEFARRLDLMLNDDEIRQSWIKWAKAYVQQFSYHQVVDMYEKFYKQHLK